MDAYQQNAPNQDGPNSQRFSQAVNRLRSEVDRLVDMAWTRGEEVWGQFKQTDMGCDWTPETDVVETAESVVVFINLPGISAEQVDITLIGNTLEISAHVDSLTLQAADRVHKRERPTGVLKRTIPLPVAVDYDSAIAEADRGVLKIEMKKSIDKQAHKVRVVQAESAVASPGPAGV